LGAGARTPDRRDVDLVLDLARSSVAHREIDLAALDANVGKRATIE
jgi:hypothetical protein